jgi:hypothetical protein
MVPHHLTIDRCYIHAWPGQALKRGVALNSAETTITNSYLSDFKSTFDSQAIWGWNGPGPFHITNNYLEAAGENAGFGGTEPAIAGLVPSDIEFRHNLCRKQLSWRGVWLVKNMFELKTGQRVIVDGNVLEYNWADGQPGYAILFTPGNGIQAQTALVQEVTITNNLIRHSGAGVNILDYGTNQASRQTNHIVIRNNLFDDINAVTWGGEGTFVKITGTPYVTVDHNTVVHSGNDITAYQSSWGGASANFVFTNNVMAHNDYGVFGGGQSPGNLSLSVYFPNAVFRKNLIAGANGDLYPSDNLYPPSLAAAKFVNAARGDYRLAQNSPLKRHGTNGTDIGCDIEALRAALGETERNLLPAG